MLDQLEDLKQLIVFLGIVNYVKPFIKKLSALTPPLYNKTTLNRTNNKDIQLLIVHNLKRLKNLFIEIF